MVTVQNIAANKLDWYIDPEVTVAARPQLGSEAWQVRLTVGIENPERERTSVALESARPAQEYRGGMHRAVLAVYRHGARSEERRVGKESVRARRYRATADPYKNKTHHRHSEPSINDKLT